MINRSKIQEEYLIFSANFLLELFFSFEHPSKHHNICQKIAYRPYVDKIPTQMTHFREFSRSFREIITCKRRQHSLRSARRVASRRASCGPSGSMSSTASTNRPSCVVQAV
jgi:hypothetical protein